MHSSKYYKCMLTTNRCTAVYSTVRPSMWETASDRVIRIEVCILTWIEVHHVLRLFPHLETLEAGRAAAEYTQDLHTHTHTHTRLTAPFPGLPGWAGTRKVKPIWILLKQETVSGSGISWVICKFAPCSRQITMPAPHYSVFTGRMPFLPPNQQSQSTEGQLSVKYSYCNGRI